MCNKSVFLMSVYLDTLGMNEREGTAICEADERISESSKGKALEDVDRAYSYLRRLSRYRILLETLCEGGYAG